ncbi:hypothetical protein SynMVIR181_02502 [Synechococcus sp. MVIR-18-1]|nr:hypothetical protein SynMVIR181_02502 [Synechococcus sp. MVIR-18-1]
MGHLEMSLEPKHAVNALRLKSESLSFAYQTQIHCKQAEYLPIRPAFRPMSCTP